MEVHAMSTHPERLLRPLWPEPLRLRDDKASNCQAVVFIVQIPGKPLGVCRVLTPEVTCVPPQLVQLVVLVFFGLRARGNRDIRARLVQTAQIQDWDNLTPAQQQEALNWGIVTILTGRTLDSAVMTMRAEKYN
jgi:hypothetical protein